jgi:hypothetical protein
MEKDDKIGRKVEKGSELAREKQRLRRESARYIKTDKK